jgi:hypothetical protein
MVRISVRVLAGQGVSNLCWAPVPFFPWCRYTLLLFKIDKEKLD